MKTGGHRGAAYPATPKTAKSPDWEQLRNRDTFDRLFPGCDPKDITPRRNWPFEAPPPGALQIDAEIRKGMLGARPRFPSSINSADGSQQCRYFVARRFLWAAILRAPDVCSSNRAQREERERLRELSKVMPRAAASLAKKISEFRNKFESQLADASIEMFGHRHGATDPDAAQAQRDKAGEYLRDLLLVETTVKEIGSLVEDVKTLTKPLTANADAGMYFFIESMGHAWRYLTAAPSKDEPPARGKPFINFVRAAALDLGFEPPNDVIVREAMHYATSHKRWSRFIGDIQKRILGPDPCDVCDLDGQNWLMWIKKVNYIAASQQPPDPDTKTKALNELRALYATTSEFGRQYMRRRLHFRPD